MNNFDIGSICRGKTTRLYPTIVVGELVDQYEDLGFIKHFPAIYVPADQKVYNVWPETLELVSGQLSLNFDPND